MAAVQGLAVVVGDLRIFVLIPAHSVVFHGIQLGFHDRSQHRCGGVGHVPPVVAQVHSEDGLLGFDAAAGEEDVGAGRKHGGNLYPLYLRYGFVIVCRIVATQQADREVGAGFIVLDMHLDSAERLDDGGRDRGDCGFQGGEGELHRLRTLLVHVEGVDLDDVLLGICVALDGEAVDITGYLGVHHLTVTFIFGNHALQVGVVGDVNLYDHSPSDGVAAPDGNGLGRRHVGMLVDSAAHVAHAARYGNDS